MRASVYILPADLPPTFGDAATIVVFDVLRATTSMIAALDAGAESIQAFPNLEAARIAAAADCTSSKLLCGEQNCLAPEGFDLGNSPAGFTRERCAGRTLFMSTTNGTRAIVAGQSASRLYVAALVNASATARHLVRAGNDVGLLCSGTNGRIAMEDLVGAGAVLDAMVRSAPTIELDDDVALIALRIFRESRADLHGALSETQGGRNVLAARLTGDIAFAARLDASEMVAVVTGSPPTVRAFRDAS